MGRCTGGGWLKSWMLMNIHACKYSAFVTDWQPHWVHMSLFFDHFYFPLFSLLAGNWFWGLLHGRFVLSFSLKLLSVIATETQCHYHSCSVVLLSLKAFLPILFLFSLLWYFTVLQFGIIPLSWHSVWPLNLETNLSQLCFFFKFFMCVDVLLACMSVSHAYLVPQEGRRGRRILWN